MSEDGVPNLLLEALRMLHMYLWYTPLLRSLSDCLDRPGLDEYSRISLCL